MPLNICLQSAAKLGSRDIFFKSNTLLHLLPTTLLRHVFEGRILVLFLLMVLFHLLLLLWLWNVGLLLLTILTSTIIHLLVRLIYRWPITTNRVLITTMRDINMDVFTKII